MPRSFLITRSDRNPVRDVVDDDTKQDFGGCGSPTAQKDNADSREEVLDTPMELTKERNRYAVNGGDGDGAAGTQINDTVARDEVKEVNGKEEKDEGEDLEYETVSANHDYLELDVDVKEEMDDPGDDEDHFRDTPTQSPPKRPLPQEFFNLAQLAEISLAAEGKLDNKDLSDVIKKAREKQHWESLNKQRLIPANSSPGPRTMQIVLPDNASHIIICTNNNNNENALVSRSRTGVSSDHDIASKRQKISPKTVPNQGFNCSECGKTYSTSSNLARHKQTHRSLQDKKAKKCPQCGKVYVSMPAFSMHLRTHNQTCKCTICGKAFSRPWLLQGHIRTHTGERPFPCHLCPKAFADKSNLRAHIQTHSNSKPHKCKKCGKTFALKSYLCKHEESACNSQNNANVKRKLQVETV